MKKEEPPVCVACNTTITVKHTLTECVDLVEVRKKYFDERSLYSLFPNVNPEKIFDYVKEIGMFYKVLGILKYIVCGKTFILKYFNCDTEKLLFCRNMCDFVCVCVGVCVCLK